MIFLRLVGDITEIWAQWFKVEYSVQNVQVKEKFMLNAHLLFIDYNYYDTEYRTLTQIKICELVFPTSFIALNYSSVKNIYLPRT